MVKSLKEFITEAVDKAIDSVARHSGAAHGVPPTKRQAEKAHAHAKTVKDPAERKKLVHHTKKILQHSIAVHRAEKDREHNIAHKHHRAIDKHHDAISKVADKHYEKND